MPVCLAILLKAVFQFSTTYFSDIDIHSLVTSYEHEARKKVLSAFYLAHNILPLLAEALSGRASILFFAVFGGQCINELQTLFDSYRPFVEPFLTSAVDEILQPRASASSSQGTAFYEHGMNVITWLTGGPAPPNCLLCLRLASDRHAAT